MIGGILAHLARIVQALLPHHKRWLFILCDSSSAAISVWITTCFLSDIDAGLALALIAGSLVLGGGLSSLLALNRTKLNTFLQTGVHRAAAFGAILACGFAAVLMVFDPAPAMTGASLLAPLAFGCLVLSRAAMLHLMLWLLALRQTPVRVLIYGSGNTGQQLLAALRAHATILPVAFVDDDQKLHGKSVAGLQVHAPDSINSLSLRHRIDRVLLAMPSLPAARLQQISRSLFSAGLAVHTLPSFAELVGAEALCDHLAPLQPDEVLGRTQLLWDLDSRAGSYRDRCVLVTGAGGSVGSELCRQILSLAPRRLVLFELCERALYDIHRALLALPMAQAVTIVPFLGSACDARAVRAALADNSVDVVIHAAAYKHVPLVEANPLAGLANNVFGTKVIVDAAHRAGVERVLFISTDKAVRPTNVMGASKRLAELVMQDMAKRPGATTFSVVRFGNVLGSSGSVIPLFRDQIAKGGPITLTHDDVTRYFMSLAEAAQLVLFAGSLDRRQGGGDGAVFVLDMGDPIRIRDLAVQMVRSSGLTVRDATSPDGNIAISVIGLRPGEKLHEDLLITQRMVSTLHPKIMRANEPSISAFELAGVLQALQAAIDAGDGDLARLVVEAAVQPREADAAIDAMSGLGRAWG